MIRKAIQTEKEKKICEDMFYSMLVLEQLELGKLNENLNESVGDILKKFGLELEKKSPGVIEYAAKFTKGLGLFVYYALKKDTEKIKELMGKFKKEDLMDFLMKLDMVTLHMITGPIHFINGITGWDLEAHIQKIKNAGENAIDTIKKTITKLKTDISTAFDSTLRAVAFSKLDDLEKILQ